jgi:ubiquitin carboxyl-terminal hydrolase 25
LRSLAKKYNNHTELEVLAIDLEREAGEPWMTDDDSITVALGPASQSTARPAPDASLPVGLVNIRNTCYLNSLLQYFNTVLPVRDVVLNWEEYKLEPTEENIRTRRLGGSGSALDRAEAFLAAKFVEEMRSLFLDLQSSSESAIRPQQRLALAALKTADQLVKGKPVEAYTVAAGPQPKPGASDTDLPPPPPLPARPSPKAPTQSAQPTVTVNAVSEHADTASNVSSSTLVDQRDDDADQTYVTISQNPADDKDIPQVVPAKQRVALEEEDKEQAVGPRDGGRRRSVDRESGILDTEMCGTDENVAAIGTEAKVEQALSVEEKITGALNDVSVTGTEQQDVEEVMGNILEHLHAAIKPTGTDEHTGKQTDTITETFYWSSVKKIRTLDMNTGKPKSEYRSVPDLSRWMTAFPAKEGKIDLYKALDSNFDQEFQEDGHETYSSITRASPILHVYIQRSQNVNGKLSRNNNVVEIPEKLYLDRYMDGPVDSDLFKKRQRSWQLKRRLEALDRPPQHEQVGSQTGDAKDKVKEAGYEVLDVSDTVLDAFERDVRTVEEEDYVSILTPSLEETFVAQGKLPSPAQPSKGDVTMGGTALQPLVDLSSDAVRHLLEFNENSKERERQELSNLFTDMKTVAYRLHAVICHGGGLGSGHYWVWIYDFERNVWRSYNDERVEVHANKDKVLNDLNNGASPYYVAYVREDEVDRLVRIPERHISAPAEQAITAADEVIQSVDTDMLDAAVVSHVENRE